MIGIEHVMTVGALLFSIGLFVALTRRNAVGVLMGVAGLYITLSADFVAVVQVLIYVGAISVLMLFAILLTPRSARDNAVVPYAAPVAVIAGLVGAVIIYAALDTDWRTVGDAGFSAGTARLIGAALLDPFALPFEVASVLLVVAMIGAIVLVHAGEEAEL